MHARLTLGDVRASRIPSVLSVCADDARVTQFVNEAQQRLIPKAKWANTFARIQICVLNGNLSWPRQVATIEAAAICKQPILLRNSWWEYINAGVGIQARDEDGHCCGCGAGLQLIDRGSSCLIADIFGTDRKIRAYVENAGDVNKQILIKAKDQDGNKIYTVVSGVAVEGFYLTLPASGYIDGPAAAGVFVSEVYGIIKPVTLANVKLYQRDTANANQFLIADLEPDETSPSYRRSLIPALSEGGACCNDDECDEGEKQITAEVKLDYIPVSRDTDFLTIDWLPALKEMCQSIQYGEMDSMEAKNKSMLHEARAIKALDDELAHYLGSGATVPIEIDSVTWGMRMANVY